MNKGRKGEALTTYREFNYTLKQYWKMHTSLEIIARKRRNVNEHSIIILNFLIYSLRLMIRGVHTAHCALSLISLVEIINFVEKVIENSKILSKLHVISINMSGHVDEI